jgi:hypothetical protein
MTKPEITTAAQSIVLKLDALRESPIAKTLTITVEEIYLHKLIGLAEGLAMCGQPQLLNTLTETAKGLTIEPLQSTDKA